MTVDATVEGDVVDAAERGKVLMGFLMAAFTILGAVVLLNLLVAMMGDTYAKVSENAVAKWRLERDQSRASRCSYEVKPSTSWT